MIYQDIGREESLWNIDWSIECKKDRYEFFNVDITTKKVE